MNRPLHTLLTWLHAIVISFSATLVVRASEDEDPYISALKSIVSTPVDNLQVKFRITSRFPDGHVVTKKIETTYRYLVGGRELKVQEIGNKKNRHCFVCSTDGKLSSCAGDNIIDYKMFVDGTLLRWGEILGGFCNAFIFRRSQAADESYAVVRITPTHTLPWNYSLVFFDEKALPTRIERYTEDNKLARTIQVIDAKRTSRGTGMTRSWLTEPGMDGKVLLELISVVTLDQELIL